MFSQWTLLLCHCSLSKEKNIILFFFLKCLLENDTRSNYLYFISIANLLFRLLCPRVIFFPGIFFSLLRKCEWIDFWEIVIFLGFAIKWNRQQCCRWKLERWSGVKWNPFHGSVTGSYLFSIDWTRVFQRRRVLERTFAKTVSF